MKILTRLTLGLLVLLASCTPAEKGPKDARQERRILYNSDTGNAFAEYWNQGAPLSTMDGEAVKAIVTNGIDELAKAGVDTLVMVVSHRFHTVYGPSRVLEDEWRHPEKDDGYRSLRDEGLDFRQLMAELCHQRGMEFFACIRMNDRHGGLAVGRIIRENPQWHLKLPGGPAIDFAPEPVRAKLLAYIEELLATVEVDGLEFDYMRWCHMFPPGQGAENAHLLTDFMQKTRALLDAAARQKSRSRLMLGVRVPQTLKECEYLGFDVAAWIQQGLVDFVVPSDFFYTDLNTRVEEYVKLAEGTDCRIYPAIHPVTYRGDDVGINNLSHYRAAAQNFYAYGASGVETYNYQYHWGRRIGRNTPGRGTCGRRHWATCSTCATRRTSPGTIVITGSIPCGRKAPPRARAPRMTGSNWTGPKRTRRARNGFGWRKTCAKPSFAPPCSSRLWVSLKRSPWRSVSTAAWFRTSRSRATWTPTDRTNGKAKRYLLSIST